MRGKTSKSATKKAQRNTKTDSKGGTKRTTQPSAQSRTVSRGIRQPVSYIDRNTLQEAEDMLFNRSYAETSSEPDYDAGSLPMSTFADPNYSLSELQRVNVINRLETLDACNQVLADKIKRIESFLTNLINQQRGGVNIRV